MMGLHIIISSTSLLFQLIISKLFLMMGLHSLKSHFLIKEWRRRVGGRGVLSLGSFRQQNKYHLIQLLVNVDFNYWKDLYND